MPPQFCIDRFKYPFQRHCPVVHYPFFHCFYLTAQLLLTRFHSATEKLLLSVHSAIKCEAKEVKGIWFSLAPPFPVLPGKPPKLQYFRLFFCKFKSILGKTFFQSLSEYFCFVPVLKTTDKVSRPRELPPESLSELYVNLSAHTAPIIQPMAVSQISSVQTSFCHALLPLQANVLLFSLLHDSYTFYAPTLPDTH